MFYSSTAIDTHPDD